MKALHLSSSLTRKFICNTPRPAPSCTKCWVLRRRCLTDAGINDPHASPPLCGLFCDFFTGLKAVSKASCALIRSTVWLVFDLALGTVLLVLLSLSSHSGVSAAT